jgi:hypothetical protein
MKKMLLMSLIFLLAGGLLFTAAPASAGAPKTDFNLQESCAPAPEIGPVKTVGGRIIMRDLLLTCAITADDPRLVGTEVLTFNVNFDLDTFSGPMWGTFVITNEGGGWEGVMVGKRNPDGSSFGNSIAHGFGDYEGLIAKWTMQHAADPYAPFVAVGYILETGRH